MEEPSLFREIGHVAWVVTKVLVAIASVIALFLLLFQHHLFIGLSVFWSLVVIAQIVYAGWQSYTWKKSQQDQEAQWHERDREWREARERLRA